MYGHQMLLLGMHGNNVLSDQAPKGCPNSDHWVLYLVTTIESIHYSARAVITDSSSGENFPLVDSGRRILLLYEF